MAGRTARRLPGPRRSSGRARSVVSAGPPPGSRMRTPELTRNPARGGGGGGGSRDSGGVGSGLSRRSARRPSSSPASSRSPRSCRLGGTYGLTAGGKPSTPTAATGLDNPTLASPV